MLSFLNPSATDIDTLCSFPFFDSDLLLSLLNAELPAYMAKAGVDLSTGNDCIKWWMEIKVNFLNGHLLPKKCRLCSLLLQPLRVSCLFRVQEQDSYIKDYIESCSLEAIQMPRTRVYSMPPTTFWGIFISTSEYRVPDNGEDEK